MNLSLPKSQLSSLFCPKRFFVLTFCSLIFRTAFVSSVLCSLLLAISTGAADFTDANWLSMGGLPGLNATVRAAATDVSGNLYVGGDFSIAGDVFASRVAKWNGTSWSRLGTGIQGSVYAMALSGSDLYVGGAFTMA